MTEEAIKLNRELAERLRITSNNQYHCLVNMHLTHVLDFSSLSFISDENEPVPPVYDKTKSKKWIGFNKKTKACHKSNNSPPDNIPVLTQQTIKNMKLLIDFLQLEENVSQEGIFRKTGSVARQQELKFLINQGKPFRLDSGEFTAHDVASVLKSLLADLPEPLLTEVYYPAYCQVAEICNIGSEANESRIKDSLQLLFLLLPKENQTVLENLIILLHKTSLQEVKNKMNSDTLATLFTPHLICPRKLPPEVLHQTAATLSSVISFIIKNGQTVFSVPQNLTTDIKAYFVEQKKRKTMSPEKILDESTSDSVANTVFTFVDHKRSVEEDAGHTDSQLAQLYAHIQSLPESRHKKKLIKQFNKQNGHGTPLQIVMLNREKQSSSCRSISDSIKKHIFHKNLIHKTPKRTSNSSNTPSTSHNTPVTFQTPNAGISVPKSRVLFQSPIYSVNSPKSNTTPASLNKPSTEISKATPSSTVVSRTSSSESNDQFHSIEEKSESSNDVPESQTEASNDFLSDDEDFCSSSESLDRLDEKDPAEPLATQSKAQSEPDLVSLETTGDTLEEQDVFLTPFKPAYKKLIKGVSMSNLKFPSQKHSPKSIKKSKSSSLLADDRAKLLNESDIPESEESIKIFMDRGDNWDVSKINYFQNTSTVKEQDQTTRNSMSPITKSTQRMPKSMQESIMTPRSRKPVMLMGALFGGLDDQKPFHSPLLEDENSLTDDSLPQQQYEQFVNSESSSSESAGNSEVSEPQLKIENDISTANDNGLPLVEPPREPLSNAFLNYLSRRSLLTENMLSSVDDSSFCSQPNDYNSSMEGEDFGEEKENSSSELDKLINMSEGDLSESMLYCMNGNDLDVSGVSPSGSSRKRPMSQQNDADEKISKYLAVSTETNL